MVVEPRWLTFDEVELIHADQLERYKGTEGTKDENLVHGALAYPQNKYHYDGEYDLVNLAAALCFAIAKGHGYVDGNKRTATAAMILFLEVNGATLEMLDIDGYEPLADLVEALADDRISLDVFADEIAPHIYML